MNHWRTFFYSFFFFVLLLIGLVAKVFVWVTVVDTNKNRCWLCRIKFYSCYCVQPIYLTLQAALRICHNIRFVHVLRSARFYLYDILFLRFRTIDNESFDLSIKAFGAGHCSKSMTFDKHCINASNSICWLWILISFVHSLKWWFYQNSKWISIDSQAFLWFFFVVVFVFLFDLLKNSRKSLNVWMKKWYANALANKLWVWLENGSIELI